MDEDSISMTCVEFTANKKKTIQYFCFDKLTAKINEAINMFSYQKEILLHDSVLLEIVSD